MAEKLSRPSLVKLKLHKVTINIPLRRCRCVTLPEVILAGINECQFGPTEGSHVHRDGGVQSAGVHHQLDLLQADGGELSLEPEAVVVRPLEACKSLYGTAARLVSQRSEVKFLPSAAAPACNIRMKLQDN